MPSFTNSTSATFIPTINLLQDSNTLLAIVIISTVTGLALLILLALCVIYLISKYCIHSRFVRRRKRLIVNSARNGHKWTLSYERYTDAPVKPLNHSSTQRKITTSQLELQLFTNRNGKSYQIDEKQPLVLEDLPSPPDPTEHDIIGLDTLQRANWAQRNTSFRLAQDAKQQLIEKYQNGDRKSVPFDSDDSDLEEFLHGLPTLQPKSATAGSQPGRVATVKITNSLKHNTFNSFREHMKQFDNQNRRTGGNVKVAPPTVSEKQVETYRPTDKTNQSPP